MQITLIRTRHARWHRKLGVAAMLLGAMIPVIGVATSLEMARFDLDHGLYDAVESAAFARFPFITITALRWYPGVDALLLLAIAQDIWVGRRVHRAYAISLPLVVSGQIAAMWLYLARPTWWVEFTQRLF